MCKYVWAIATKQDNVWIEWDNYVYIQDVNWWEYQPKAYVSWYWRKICATKEQLKQVYSQADLCGMVQYVFSKTGLY